MKIVLASVFVHDQEKALQFYTEVLGFVTAMDMPMGPDARWLTVRSPEGPEGIQLLLEPMGHPAAPVFQAALFEAGIPYTSFGVDNLQQEYERLTGLGVVFRMPPTEMGGTFNAIFEDTCGNLINLHQG